MLIISVAAALALAGCGGSSGTSGHPSSSTVTTNSATAPNTTSTATTTTSSTSSTPATTTTAASVPAICRASELSASFLGGQAATGHGLLGFALRNQSANTCTTYGYPGVQFLSQSGQPLRTNSTRTTTDFFGTLPKPLLTVAPGAIVSFRLGVTHGAASTAGCTTAYALQVIPPNDTATLRVPIPNGAYECQTATVSPMQQGTSAYP
ncbi:MAG TPA: DUF4232 domain-containing protein [Solirubrobacteraceae bacterium]|nr:DUF4232 domain-containing protein [Solirubrobacteraceae bacterium]